MKHSPYVFSPDDAERFAKEQNIKTFRRYGQLHFQFCPYCGGNANKDKKTFAIDLETGQFNCFRASCGAKGNMITLAKDFNFSLGTEADEYFNSTRRFRNIHRKEKPKPKPPAIEYMERRGISEAVAEEYNITVQNDHENVLVFPFYDENNVMRFVKYRKTDFDREKDSSKEWCERDCMPVLFGMNHCNPETSKTLIMTEGQIDSLSLIEAGIKNAVSVPTGAKGFTWVPYCWDFLQKFDTLIIFGDYENGKITLLEEMRTRFRHGCVKHVRPEDYKGCKDANEILLKYGRSALQKAVENAEPVRNPKIKPLEEVKRMNLSQMEKVTTGIGELDKYLSGGFYFGQLIILTGKRGEGKSTLASQFATFAINEGYPTFFYSGELMDWYFKAWFEQQAAGDRFVNTLISTLGYKTYSVRAEIMPDLEAWYFGKAFIYDNQIIQDDSEEETLLKTIEDAIVRYGCRMIAVDNLMTAMIDDISSDLYRSQTNFVKELARLAKQYNVIILLVAHPRKSNGFEMDNDDVAGSANITNLADVVLKYGKPKGDDVEKDTPDRRLSIFKNRLTGRINSDGILLHYQESSKRISDTENFDWKFGWENDINSFVTLEDEGDTPFD